MAPGLDGEWSPVSVWLLMPSVVSRKLLGSCSQERLCPVDPRPGSQGGSLRLASSPIRGGPALTSQVTLDSPHPLQGSPVLFHGIPVLGLAGMHAGHAGGG